MTPHSIADLKHRLVVEAQSRVGDGGGGAVATWTPLAEVWGAIRPSGGAERVEGDGNTGRVTHTVIIRWRRDVTPAMRLREGTRVFDVRAAFDPADDRRWLVCLCEERVG